MQEEDHELEEVRCKHGFVLPLLTSWTSRNPGRRYWGCPYYGVSLIFFSRIDLQEHILICGVVLFTLEC